MNRPVRPLSKRRSSRRKLGADRGCSLRHQRVDLAGAVERLGASASVGAGAVAGHDARGDRREDRVLVAA